MLEVGFRNERQCEGDVVKAAHRENIRQLERRNWSQNDEAGFCVTNAKFLVSANECFGFVANKCFQAGATAKEDVDAANCCKRRIQVNSAWSFGTENAGSDALQCAWGEVLSVLKRFFATNFRERAGNVFFFA